MSYKLSSYNAPGEADQLLRHNDGSLVIMQTDGEEGAEDAENRPCLLVPRVNPAKRGEAWKTPDPDQEAFARRVVALLNRSLELSRQGVDLLEVQP